MVERLSLMTNDAWVVLQHGSCSLFGPGVGPAANPGSGTKASDRRKGRGKQAAAEAAAAAAAEELDSLQAR